MNAEVGRPTELEDAAVTTVCRFWSSSGLGGNTSDKHYYFSSSSSNQDGPFHQNWFSTMSSRAIPLEIRSAGFSTPGMRNSVMDCVLATRLATKVVHVDGAASIQRRTLINESNTERESNRFLDLFKE